MLSPYVCFRYRSWRGTANDEQVGNEFGSVEALWSQFEHFMGRSADGQEGQEQGTGTAQGQSQGQSQEDHDEGKTQEVKYEDEESEGS